MSDPFYLGAYWGPRQEAADECAERLARCLSDLARASDLLARWYLRANRKSEATRAPVSADPETLTALLESGQNRREVDREPIVELGFSAGLWNGDYTRAAGIAVKCGAWSTAVPNSFVLNLPAADEGASDLYTRDLAEELIRSLIDAWKPDWATFTSHALREAQQPEPGTPVFGWATYLASRNGLPESKVPPGTEIESLDAGVLVTIGPDPTNVSEAALLATRDILNAAC